jgi:protein-tyrosine phosphatase
MSLGHDTADVPERTRDTIVSVKRVLFVCTGNICRSPTAEGVARAKAIARGVDDRLEFDSAGVESYHAGESPDRRARTRAALRGYDLSTLRARKITAADFKEFDLILAMDRGHLAELDRMCPDPFRDKLKLFTSYSEKYAERDVPDPYYGHDRDFDRVLDMCEEVVDRLVIAASRQ